MSFDQAFHTYPNYFEGQNNILAQAEIGGHSQQTPAAPRALSRARPCPVTGTRSSTRCSADCLMPPRVTGNEPLLKVGLGKVRIRERGALEAPECNTAGNVIL